jgi:hypothetical protein
MIEEIFKAGSEQVDHEDIVQAFLSKVVDIGNAWTADQYLISSVLIAQLRRVALSGLEFDGDLLVVEQIGALEDDAERALSYLLADAVVHTDNIGGGGGHAVGVWRSNDDSVSARALIVGGVRCLVVFCGREGVR